MSIIYKPEDIIASERYEIIRLIGEGGSGTVYQGRNRKTAQEVAIKVLRNELIEDSKHVAIFKHEAKLAAKLRHPNIVAVHESVADQQQEKTIYLLVMEYLAGGSLAAQIKSDISVEQSIKWIKQLLSATAYAHEKGIIHQDIKSANVLLNGEGEVKIGDFGLARLADSPHSDVSDPALTPKKGTPAYMSPELCYGEIQDERSDIYSLGVLFFELLTGQLPFHAEGMIELARQHTSRPVPSIMRLNANLPSLLDEVIRRMMAKDKDARYQSARQILSAIEHL
jgi:eukaryotic-like serine/threonine-protein kinase